MRFRKSLILFSLLCFSTLISCGEEEAGNVSVVLGMSDVILIPIDTVSCHAKAVAQGTGQPAVNDVLGSYFSIARIFITRKEAKLPLVISYIKITGMDHEGQEISKIYSGDELLALSTEWSKTGVAGTQDGLGGTPHTSKSIATNCPAYLGGFGLGATISGTAFVEVVGYEGSEISNVKVSPFKATTTVNYSSNF